MQGDNAYADIIGSNRVLRRCNMANGNGFADVTELRFLGPESQDDSLRGILLISLHLLFILGSLVTTGSAAGSTETGARSINGIEIVLSRTAARNDEEVNVKVVGLPAYRPITVRAELKDARGVTWTSSGHYFAAESGTVDLAVSPSVRGSYTGVDGEGLFWSLLPMPTKDLERQARDTSTRPPPRRPVLDATKSYTMQFEAISDGVVTARATLERRFLDENVEARSVNEGDVRGVLFRPEHADKAPSLLLIGGSSGGVQDRLAALLASRGIATFTQAWHGFGDWPRFRSRVPIEIFVDGLEWLAEQTNGPLALMGTSWGSEAASLTAQLIPELLDGLILVVPSPMVTSGYGGSGSNPYDVAKFTIAGKLVPFALPDFPTSVTETKGINCGFDSPLDVRSDYLKAWLSAENKQLRFNFEGLNAPVLLIGSEADETWPSAAAVRMIEEQLSGHKGVETLIFSAATHLSHVPNDVRLLFPIFDPLIACFMGPGGLRQDSAAASKESFERIVKFVGQL